MRVCTCVLRQKKVCFKYNIINSKRWLFKRLLTSGWPVNLKKKKQYMYSLMIMPIWRDSYSRYRWSEMTTNLTTIYNDDVINDVCINCGILVDVVLGIPMLLFYCKHCQLIMFSFQTQFSSGIKHVIVIFNWLLLKTWALTWHFFY